MRIVDLHTDAICELSARGFLRYVRRAGRAGVRVILASVWTTEMRDPMQKIARARKLIDKINAQTTKFSRDQIPPLSVSHTASVSSRVAPATSTRATPTHPTPRVLLHIENGWFITPENLDDVIALRPFSVGLTWNADNNLAGGARGSGDLTEFGRVVVSRLIDAGVRIDTAHLNEKSFWSVASAPKPPVFCSHACFSAVEQNVRNISGDQIRAIIDGGGVVGLTFVGRFLCGSRGNRAGVRDIYAHIRYFLDNFGVDNIAIGTDFCGTTDLPKGVRNYKGFRKVEKFFLARGVSHEIIAKIFYENAEKFILGI